MAYYKAIDSLSDDSDTNWLLTSHPDLYVYGALTHSAPYLKDDERIATWGALYKSALVGLQMESDRADYSGSVLQMKTKWP